VGWPGSPGLYSGVFATLRVIITSLPEVARSLSAEGMPERIARRYAAEFHYQFEGEEAAGLIFYR